MRTRITDSRMVKIAALGAALAVAVVASPLAAEAASARPGSGGCPTSTEIARHFGVGMTALVRDGALERAEAADATRQFTQWVRDDAPAELGCDFRAAMMDRGREVLDLIGLGPMEARQAFQDGQALAEMAAANNVDRDELVETLNRIVADGLDQMAAAGAIEAGVVDAIEEHAAERIETAVDFERGDPRPAGFDHNRDRGDLHDQG